MEYINSIDKGIDDVLDNNLFYSILVCGLIAYCTFSTVTQITYTINFENALVKILVLLCILYFARKDLRISLLLTIIFLIELDKINTEEIKTNMVTLLVKDASLEERISKLEKNRK